MEEKITFIDPETNEEVEFYCLEQTTLNGSNYILVTSEPEGDSDAYILKETSSDDDEVTYSMVEDDVEINAVGKVFAELLEDVDFE
ncbi:MAG: DUF1292 domain-containing protein [Lachnospiraceae bacterium]|nr:DUF1292 domain-containing protein [Lachnospiraceae bacterium]